MYARPRFINKLININFQYVFKLVRAVGSAVLQNAAASIIHNVGHKAALRNRRVNGGKLSARGKRSLIGDSERLEVDGNRVETLRVPVCVALSKFIVELCKRQRAKVFKFQRAGIAQINIEHTCLKPGRRLFVIRKPRVRSAGQQCRYYEHGERG